MTYAKTASIRLHLEGWTETVAEDVDEGKGTERNGVYYPSKGLTSAEASFRYSGDLEATSTSYMFITYREGDAPVIGFERVSGTLDGRAGSFILRNDGMHAADNAVRGRAEVVEGLGSGELESLRGEMEVVLEGAPPQDGYPLTLHYDLD